MPHICGAGCLKLTIKRGAAVYAVAPYLYTYMCAIPIFNPANLPNRPLFRNFAYTNIFHYGE